MPSNASVEHEGRQGAQRHECTHEKTQRCGKTIYPIALLPSYKGNLKDRHDYYCNRREQKEYCNCKRRLGEPKCAGNTEQYVSRDECNIICNQTEHCRGATFKTAVIDPLPEAKYL